MRLALLCDIHGNRHALDAILDHASRQAPDHTVVMGDVVIGAADSRACWRFVHHAVPYDVDGALARFRESGYLTEAGPMARLFYREVATASNHVVPFLRCYETWSRNGSPSLAEAVDRFLQM